MKMLLVVLVAVFAAVNAEEEVHYDPVPDYLFHGTCGTPEHPAMYTFLDPAVPFPLPKIISQTKEFFSYIFEESCHIDGGSFTEFFSDPENECLDIFLQSYCYTQSATSRTSDVGLTFEQLDQEIPEIGDVTDVWCKNKCSTVLLPHVWRCYTDPEIKPHVVKKISDQWAWFKTQIEANKEYLDGTPIGRILLLTLENWVTWSDVGESIKVNRPAILKMFGDLRFNFADFCHADCVAPSFKYAHELVQTMHHGGCDRPRWFCGECQENARSYINDPDHHIPCCFQRIFDWVLSRTDAGVAAAQGVGDAYLLSDVAVLSSKNEDFQCWRSVLQPEIFRPGLIWRCSLGKTV